MRNPRPGANEPVGRPTSSRPGRIQPRRIPLSTGRPGRARAAAACAAVLALVLLAAITVVPAYAAPARATTEQSVAEALTCQCGCGLTIANCNHPNCSFAVPTRAKIDAMIGRGMGRAQIIAYFRAEYGEKILSAPTTHGFNLLAWTMPFVALFFGGAIVFVVMGRWRGEAPVEPPPPGAPHDAKADSALRERLERELRERI